MSIAASGDGFTSSEDEGAVGLPPSGVVATAAPDPELTAMLARAAVSIGLEVNKPPSPEPSRLDDWFLGAGRGSQPRPAPVPFFPEVHEELTSSWMAPFMARSRSSASSILTTLDGGVARGHAGIPQVERAVAVHLCPRNAATWRNRLRLPSKACKLTAALAAKAYSAAGQAASALHAMAILQVHQAKALKQVHEGSTDQGLMQELRTATDFALRATKVTARVPREGDVHHGGPGAPSLAQPGRGRQGTLSRRPHLPGRAFRRHRRGLRPAVLSGTAADRGDPPSTAAPGARPQSARHRRCPPASSRAAPPQAESTRCVEPEELATSGQSRSGPREFGENASERTAFCAIHPYSLWLHHHRYVDCAVVAACTATGGVAHAAQPVSLAHAHNSTRLRDSVHQATSQVQRRSRDVGGSPERPCLARGDCCPPGKGCNRAGPSSRDEAGVLQPLLHRTQERWWSSDNPGSASLEPGFAQAPIQDADAQVHDQMHSAPGLVCSDRPEGHLLSRFDPSAIVSTVCVRRSGMAVQGPPHQLSLSPRVFTKVVEGALTPLREVGVRILNYLDDWLILAQSREQLGDHRDLVLRHLSQLGLRVNWEKSKLSPVQRISFLVWS